MRWRLSTVGVFLLVLVITLGGLAGCTLSAKEREAAPTEEGAAAEATGTAPSGVAGTPEPGSTVVSAVTSVPGTTAPGTTPEVQPTASPGGEATALPPPEATSPTDVIPEPPATEPPPSSSGGQAQYVSHTVQQGETLSSIARRYGTSWQAIAQANSLVNPNQIYVGQKLRIPTSGGSSGGSSGGTPGCRIRHTVKQGEWVWQIARNYGVSPYDILAANGLTVQSANTIYAGTVLCIP
jgi:LysM repeat protein